MTYAFMTEGLEPDRRDEFDERLNTDPEKLKARRERAAVDASLRAMG